MEAGSGDPRSDETFVTLRAQPLGFVEPRSNRGGELRRPPAMRNFKIQRNPAFPSTRILRNFGNSMIFKANAGSPRQHLQSSAWGQGHDRLAVEFRYERVNYAASIPTAMTA